ncbi:hypothetical protein RND71_018133 [Anisodus tanguticus]|uniref:Uncharacterized protein n=1 Tax=Anisodus tanguticus TaxID=243964 RepID=A0AAE1S456_9SOLA|nr:hypothetical protein RND71_018133 [Anisodus tanguticus]
MAENKNDWDLWAVVRSCSNINNSVHDDTRSFYNVNTSVLVDHSVHEDPTHGSKHYFGLDEVCSLSKNLNTNSRIELHNPENQTETIPNTQLLLVEHEEKKNKILDAKFEY